MQVILSLQRRCARHSTCDNTEGGGGGGDVATDTYQGLGQFKWAMQKKDGSWMNKLFLCYVLINTESTQSPRDY